MRRADVLIVGAGMAGASLAAEVAASASVILIEAESRPGYHATGRSAAFWTETYGGPLVQPLTSASGPLLAHRGFLSPRSAIHLAGAGSEASLEALAGEFAAASVPLQPLGRAELEARIPGLRPGWDRGLLEPSCMDIDVAGLHAADLAAAKRRGCRLVTDAPLQAAERSGGVWRIEAGGERYEAAVLANAAGAWADEVACVAGEPPLGIRPYRRTVAQLRTDPAAPAGLPLVIDAAGRFYFKPAAGGRLWLSPHDETPCAPSDCAPEEVDVALAIDRMEKAVDWRVERVEHAWAGLRSFAPDRLPVYGYGGDGFFWYAGQGGFGIQTAPAAAKLAASLLLGEAPDASVAGIDPGVYAPGRFAA